jgi:hypothetical protein
MSSFKIVLDGQIIGHCGGTLEDIWNWLENEGPDSGEGDICQFGTMFIYETETGELIRFIKEEE